MFAIFGLGPPEIALLVVVGVLLFGRKLPEMASHLGKSVVSFRKSMQGIEEDVATAPVSTAPPALAMQPPTRVVATAPKFEANP